MNHPLLISAIVVISLVTCGCQTRSLLSHTSMDQTALEHQTALEIPHTIRDKIDYEEYAPEMVLLPSGEFVMGSPKTEVGRDNNEGPQHKVVISKPFYLGRTQITAAQFRKFVEDSDYISDPELNNGGFIRYPDSDEWVKDPKINWRYDNRGDIAKDNFPVVNITWFDAVAFVEWLSYKTDKLYRLPTEAELEYAIRAGSTTRYTWGNRGPDRKVGNIKGELDLKVDEKSWYPTAAERQRAYQYGFTPFFFEGYGDGFSDLSPVASFPANPFGLHDSIGNVWEWTQDCYHSSYWHAPSDGSAWLSNDNGDCSSRVVRGGSYYCFPMHIRSANRWSVYSNISLMYVGFRLARDL